MTDPKGITSFSGENSMMDRKSEPEEITSLAAFLTPKMREALVAGFADAPPGEFHRRHGLRFVAGGLHSRGLTQTAPVKCSEYSLTRLTPLGLAVRNHLKEKSAPS